MKKFKFRLQRVLDTKGSDEKMRQRDLGIAQQTFNTEEERLKNLNTELREQSEKQRSLVSGSAKVADLVMNHRWQRQLNTRISKQTEEVEHCGEVVEERRQELLETSREKKVLERLKEKKFEEYRITELTAQQNALDDLGSRKRSIMVEEAEEPLSD